MDRGTPVLAAAAFNCRSTTAPFDSVTGTRSISSTSLVENAIRWPSGRLADADDDQAFPLAQLHGVIDDPHPIVGLRLGSIQLVQARRAATATE